MASGSKGLKEKFAEFATKADGKEATSKDITRWFTDAKVFGKNCTSNNLDICFSAAKPKGKPNITFNEFDDLLTRVSKSYAKDKSLSEGDAKQALIEKLLACSKAAHGTTKTSKTGGVSKMTDASQYTGSHKSRFDEEGKGKGKEGRVDKVDDSGYVTGYKEEGKYAKK